ncbi:MAG: DUF362 domain-containing protein [Deltaproteobacteria bacterium]|nr:DUF362 domain-containing protein [Deltaproteobacteria bacterium]
MAISVALCRVSKYEPKPVGKSVGMLLETIQCRPHRDARLLVKPNLLTPKKDLATTHPLVVRAVCEYFLDYGASVSVGDSPAFGTAKKVANANGLAEALSGLPVEIINLSRPTKIRLASGISIGISQKALEKDLIVNVAKLKAHSQLRVTAAVKNFFGCVVGFRKALAHCRYGDMSNLFESLLIEIMQALPETVSLVDGVTTMQRTGPIDGDPFDLSLLGASSNPVALDTALYTILGLQPHHVPLWLESQKQGLSGAHIHELSYPLAQPEEFDISGFTLPSQLKPVTFYPIRFLKGRLKSMFNGF